MTSHDKRIRSASFRPLARPLLMAMALIAAGACAGERHEFHDQGRLCIYPADPSQSGSDPGTYKYLAGEPLDVAVSFATCLPCSQESAAGCGVLTDTNPLRVTSDGSFVEKSGFAISCNDACFPFTGHCPTRALEAGTYTFVHGTDTLELTIPSEGPPPCVGQPAWP